MNHHRWKITLGIGLVLLSLGLYAAHFALFRDWHHIAIYLVGDIAFVPLEVLLVTLVLHELLSLRERQSKLQKLNMAIGVFYAEMGTELLGQMAGMETSGSTARAGLAISGSWKDSQFAETRTRVSKLEGLSFSVTPEELDNLRSYLLEKRAFLLSLLENPNLLEHEAFTDVLWAVFHITDELSHREELTSLPETDRAHLAGDMERAFKRLITEWISYMRHLRKDYPYLFSLAVRTNPFAAESDPLVRA